MTTKPAAPLPAPVAAPTPETDGVETLEHVHITDKQAYITGDPADLPDSVPDDDPRRHNCDQMGCPSLDHVLYRLPFTDHRQPIDVKALARTLAESIDFTAGPVQAREAFEKWLEVLAIPASPTAAQGQKADEIQESYNADHWCPKVCPITGREFFMWLETEEGEYVPTYGGPYDSYTIPENDGDGWACQRYDHDAGAWVGWETTGLIVMKESAASPAPADGWVMVPRECPEEVHNRIGDYLANTDQVDIATLYEWILGAAAPKVVE